MKNVDTVMKEVTDELHAELDGSPEVFVAAGYIREACTVAARTVTRTMLPNMAHEYLEDDLMECKARVLEMLRAMFEVVAEDKRLATVLIFANAVSKAAFKAGSGSKDYRTGVWAAIITKLCSSL
ncbi:unnamed protein product [Clonostachys rosea]|uniref:Uncharacterized protein n=1 Tax=Bionectria ochroleuca TaxID=29856 RepID=A0ABY6UJ85_BIOOC|nr:unnamed protein product [Clonostachys rosea]